MTKRILFVLIACIGLCFSGCQPEMPTYTPNETTQHTPETSAPVKDIPVSVAAVSLPVNIEAAYADDGTEIFVNTYQNIELVLPDPDVADKVILDLLNRIDTSSATAKDILQSAEAGYAPGSFWQSYICRNIYTPTRLDSGVFSLFGSLTTFQGSAHSESSYSSVSYDLATGDTLALHNILLPHFDIDALKDAIKEALAQQAEENYLYSNYAQVVDDRFKQDMLTDESWYFTVRGLCFYFPPYEIAPYASSVILAEVPYLKLVGILEDAYFPEDIHATQGSVVTKTFDPSAQDKYDSFWEITLEKGSEKILLHPDSPIYNIRVDAGSNDGEFIPEYTLFAASALGQKDAIVIGYDDPSSLSNLRISYTTNDKTVYQYIS